MVIWLTPLNSPRSLCMTPKSTYKQLYRTMPLKNQNKSRVSIMSNSFPIKSFNPRFILRSAIWQGLLYKGQAQH